MSYENPEPTEPTDPRTFNDHSDTSSNLSNDHDGITADSAIDPEFADLPDLPPDDDEATAELDPGERADMLFSFKVVTPPSEDEVARIQEKEASVDWLGFVTTRSPLAATFGDAEPIEQQRERGHIADSDQDRTRLRPEQSGKVVDRQLRDFSSTLSRVNEGIQATGDLAELTAEHQGRSLQWDVPMNQPEEGPTTIYTDRFVISTQPNEPVLQELRPPERPDDILRHDTPDGEIHLVDADGSGRIRIHVEDGQVRVTNQEKYTVNPSDTEYFNNLNENLTAYRDLLLQAAEHAGFDRSNIVDPETGQVNIAYLLTEVDPVLSDPAVQARIPEDLRTGLEVRAQAIAARVNPTYQEENNLSQKGFRLGGYFRLALGRRDS